MSFLKLIILLNKIKQLEAWWFQNLATYQKKNVPIHFDGFDIEVLRRDSRRLYLLRFSVNLDQVDQDILN